MKTIKRIVFTGGPCSGKTTFMSRAEEIFAERGYRVIIDNESATDLISGGISPATIGMVPFQWYCMKLQIEKENLCYRAAQEIEGDKVLLFIDRGLRDDESYVGAEVFNDILKKFDIEPDKLNDRYDMVVHLVSSAKGKEEIYGYTSNAARYETVEQARMMDDLSLEAWKSHPNRVVIGNETDFEVKMRKATQSILEYLGEGEPVEIFNKYLVEVDDEVIANVTKETNPLEIQIVQHYLMSRPGIEKRVRKRVRDGNALYYYSEAKTLSSKERIKTDRIISEREYFQQLEEANPELSVINKTRYSFIYKDRFYKLDVFDFDKTKGLLSLQVPNAQSEFELPKYIKVIKNVTDDSNYKNYYLAKSRKF